MNITYHLQNSQNNSTLLPEHLDDGQKMERLDTFVPMEESESTMSTTSQNCLVSQLLNQTSPTQSVMHASVQITKKQTLKDKSRCLKKNIQMQNSLKTLDLDSIGTDQALDPFWNTSTQELSRRLWLPTKTDCVDLDSSLWNGSSKRLMLNSWFSMRMMTSQTCLENYQTTFLQSLLSLLQKTTDSEQLITENKEKLRILKKQKQDLKRQQNYLHKIANETPEEHLIRVKNEKNYNERVIKRTDAKNKKLQKLKDKCTKDGVDWTEPEAKDTPEKSYRIKIYPSTEQKHTLRKWFGVRRWVYNRCLTLVNSGVKATCKDLRKMVINDENFKTKNTWMLDYEYDLRDEALRDFVKNIASNKAKEVGFTMKFKKRSTNNKESISVLGKKWNKKNNFYSSIFKPSLLKSSECLPEDLKYTSRLVRSGTGRYFLCIPRPLELQSENQAHNSMIFIDPGQTDFVTGFDPAGKVLICGERDSVRIARLLHYKRKLHSKITTSKGSQRKKHLKLALLRLNEKIDNLVKDLHKKLALWLCTNYKRIYIPRLNFHTCKNLNKRSKSVLASLQHCAFVDRLIHKSKEFPGCTVIEVNEAYTTKTCGGCGYQKDDINKNRVYKCDVCDLEIGRDTNASRNVMLRYFTKIFKLRIEV